MHIDTFMNFIRGKSKLTDMRRNVWIFHGVFDEKVILKRFNMITQTIEWDNEAELCSNEIIYLLHLNGVDTNYRELSDYFIKCGFGKLVC